MISKTEPDDDDGDFEFRSVVDRAWSYEDAEWIYDQENDYKISEPDGDRYSWRKKYIESLIERHRGRGGQVADRCLRGGAARKLRAAGLDQD
jgi:hypothetical protein